MNKQALFWILTALAVTGCDNRIDRAAREKPAIPTATFERLPLSGNLPTATSAGFGNCLEGDRDIRCRKDDVIAMGVGPLSAAVDFDTTRPDGRILFDHVTLWHPTDQSGTLPLGDALKEAGWQSCLTRDAELYWTNNSPVRIAIDTNYWGKRRVVIDAHSPVRTRC